MTKKEKTLLLEQGARLASLGIKVEATREKLRQLVMHGISYDDQRMQTAYASFVALDTDWKALEAEHLALRARLNAQASARKTRPQSPWRQGRESRAFRRDLFLVSCHTFIRAHRGTFAQKARLLWNAQTSRV